MKNLVLGSVAAIAATFGAAQAATLVDFTKAGSLADVVGEPDVKTTTAGGVEFRITGSPDAVNNDEVFDGDGTCAAAGLACEVDGLGMINDEFTAPAQTATIEIIGHTFNVSRIYLLDLFSDDTLGDETATITVEYTGGSTVSFNEVAIESDSENPGGFIDISGLALTNIAKLTFSATTANGTDDGDSDYAIAGFVFDDVQKMPIPGAALFFGTALIAGAAARRKRQA